jgi:Zn-dependent protease
LPNLPHLAEPVFARQRRITANPVHLLAPVLEDGFQFRLLVITQVQLLAQMLQLIVHRRHVMAAHMPSHAWGGLLVGLLTRLRWRRRRRFVLAKGGAGSEAETKQGR